MQCPHCLVQFHTKDNVQSVIKDVDGDWGVELHYCPNCEKGVLFLVNAEFEDIGYNRFNQKAKVGTIKTRYLIRPLGISRAPVPKEVSKHIKEDYEEACLVLTNSPKASAALSRRCLQTILREKAGVKHSDLAKEIQEVLDSNQLSTYVSTSIDAIRNIGNFAAHPMKSKSSGEIVEVEPGEAEWTLDVIEMLFDFYFVQPEMVKQKTDALNKKLVDAGKPPIK